MSSPHRPLNALRITLHFVFFASLVTLLTTTTVCVVARIGISEYQLHRAASLMSLISFASIVALGASESAHEYIAGNWRERYHATTAVKYRYPIMEMCILTSILDCFAILADAKFGLGGIAVPRECAWTLWASEAAIATTLVLLVGLEGYRHRGVSAANRPENPHGKHL